MDFAYDVFAHQPCAAVRIYLAQCSHLHNRYTLHIIMVICTTNIVCNTHIHLDVASVHVSAVVWHRSLQPMWNLPTKDWTHLLLNWFFGFCVLFEILQIQTGWMWHARLPVACRDSRFFFATARCSLWTDQDSALVYQWRDATVHEFIFLYPYCLNRSALFTTFTLFFVLIFFFYISILIDRNSKPKTDHFTNYAETFGVQTMPNHNHVAVTLFCKIWHCWLAMWENSSCIQSPSGVSGCIGNQKQILYFNELCRKHFNICKWQMKFNETTFKRLAFATCSTCMSRCNVYIVWLHACKQCASMGNWNSTIDCIELLNNLAEYKITNV